MSDVFISRQPLVNRQSRIIATRLQLHFSDDANLSDAARALDTVVDAWPQGEKPVFIACGERACGATLLEWGTPENVTFEVRGDDLVNDNGADLVEALRDWQPAVCLLFDRAAAHAFALGLPFRFIGFDRQTLALPQIKLLAARTRSHGIGVAFNIDQTDDFYACMDGGLAAAASWFFTVPGPTPAKTLNPGQASLIHLMNLVRNNAEIREIEAALKQDVAISYKLLRYINSAGMGLSCEVQSFRHAVTLLGYEKLNRWLSLLLATASKAPMAPAMMYTALVRGRLMELLAEGLVDRAETDNLFLTGAFSLLDALFGVAIDKVVETMALPETIVDALLGNGGRYQPFLDLVRASEKNDGVAIADQAAMLGLTAERFNRAQLQALAFAETIEL
ncbi:MAG TPA: HDOD domain-containing protein [Accumulibacter sp.]|nr:HDOD domain-containing protein [Accumulibacter sp.]HMW16547.1 HDOD domain-containing protein [Accumulibacter sp.]HMX21349.1 HDOD domain-containing protein [Accumulibacter sp.]HMY06635.1 HDOD domain-containing protein [Accumulibacter sp.]HNC18130.1 HDOD domain-containing protein [Accumulibacter sp.]